MTIRQLQEAFQTWSSARLPLVLASVFETRGSTYSKAGARMLITGDGRFQGMLSGGCLEGDLAERARAVIESAQAQTVSYDLGKNDEELWGLGVGCDGLMRIFLQPLLPAAGYQPFAAMSTLFSADAPAAAVTVIESTTPTVRAGATLLMDERQSQSFGVPGAQHEPFRRAGSEALALRRSTMVTLEIDGGRAGLLAALVLPPPRLLVLGAGPDAAPVLRFARELGWRVTMQDHRPAYLAGGQFDAADRVFCEPADRLAGTIELDRFDAAIVMSHHLATDRSYLRQLAGSRIPYVGLLGPRDRRRRLLEDLGAAADALAPRLHGPAGFDIGADGPASIALSIVAQIHDELKGRA